MKTAILSLLCLASFAVAGVPIATPDDVSRNAFNYKGKIVDLRDCRFSEKQTSPTQYDVWLGGDLTVNVLTQALPLIKGSVNAKRALYVRIVDIQSGKPVIAILGNHVGYDLRGTPVFTWAANADK